MDSRADAERDEQEQRAAADPEDVFVDTALVLPVDLARPAQHAVLPARDAQGKIRPGLHQKQAALSLIKEISPYISLYSSTALSLSA